MEHFDLLWREARIADTEVRTLAYVLSASKKAGCLDWKGFEGLRLWRIAAKLCDLQHDFVERVHELIMAGRVQVGPPFIPGAAAAKLTIDEAGKLFCQPESPLAAGYTVF